MDMQNFVISDGEINLDLFNEHKLIYILSANVNAKKIFLFLLQHKVKVQGFAVKERTENDRLYSLPVCLLDKIEGNSSVYIADKQDWDSFRSCVDETKTYFIESRDYDKNEFIFEENGETKKCNAALMVTMILSRSQKKQAVFLINSKDYDFWANLVNVLKNEIKSACIICVDTDTEKLYDLVYSDMENLILFVSIFENKEITEILTGIGLKQTQHFLYIYNSFSGHVTDRYYGFDWLLGNTFKQNEEFPGFYIHGEEKKNIKRIALLGNSASDPLFYPQKSWPEMLVDSCEKCQADVVIYNGAVTDYSSTNEVMKMLRDVLLLEPDIVVSYSGIIDFRQYVPGYPYLNLNLMRRSKKWEGESKKEVIYGVEDKRSAYERWISNQKIMHQICQIHNISFYGILQPWLGSECKKAWEKLQMWSDYYWQISFPQFDKYVDNAKEFKERIVADLKENQWLYDFTNIFSDIDDADIYFDSIHVNECGNRIVAEKVGVILGLL